MKKIFTLIAMALMAVGANAQESYLVNADTDANSFQGAWIKTFSTAWSEGEVSLWDYMD